MMFYSEAVFKVNFSKSGTLTELDRVSLQLVIPLRELGRWHFMNSATWDNTPPTQSLIHPYIVESLDKSPEEKLNGKTTVLWIEVV